MEIMKTKTDIEVTEGNGNVFSDLEINDPEEALIKAQFARAISAVIAEQGLTQAQAADILHRPSWMREKSRPRLDKVDTVLGHIEITPGIAGGKSRIAGHRITV